MPTFNKTCDITQIDQSTGDATVVVKDLPVKGPAAFAFRQTRAETAYDFQLIELYTAVPNVDVEEGMRAVFPTGENYRINSVTKWPLINPHFLALRLQGEGDGY